MAKDKAFEAAYKLERQIRTKARKAKRREKRIANLQKYGRRCPCCGHIKDYYDEDYW